MNFMARELRAYPVSRASGKNEREKEADEINIPGKKKNLGAPRKKSSI
jgi:hypothetical protein